MGEFEAALNEDIVVAGYDLGMRAGARQVQIGWLHDGVPFEDAGWYAHATYRGARITVDGRRSPSEAAQALAERLLRGATCKCGLKVTLSDLAAGCRWRLVGKRWESGCDAPTVFVDGQRGDLDALHRAIGERQRGER